MKKEESKGIVRHRPSTLLSPFEAMEKRFEDIFGKPFSRGLPAWWPSLRGAEGEIAPSIDIFEDGGDVVVKAELPGMRKEDIEVDLTDQAITISGEKKKEEKVEKKGYSYSERSYGSFSRSFTLPCEVRPDDVEATFKDGVLEIRVPKTEEAMKKVRKVTIH